ncbi:MAG: response regulator [Verrucomicrobiota bacterium]
MKKILVIDDEVWLREMIMLALNQKGYEVIEAVNGEEGIIKARQELPDLILCDVNMQKVDGYLTLSSLRSETSTAAIPFILMTGLADQAGMRHGMELGADDYLPKPFTIDGLYASVEARLKKAQLVTQRAESKLDELRENISMMLPHELRTPLNGILAFGEILASEAETLGPEEIASMGRDIFESGRRLEHLVESALNYAQLQLIGFDSKKVESLRGAVTQNAAQVIQEKAQAQADGLDRAADLTFELKPSGVSMSAEYLGKIAGELVLNALKFSKKGSAVRVQLSDADDGTLLTVVDQGRGMSSEEIAQIGPYVQFGRKIHEQQGLGLGLTICRRLTELHGGKLTVQSQLEMGTTISVKLPKARSRLRAGDFIGARPSSCTG